MNKKTAMAISAGVFVLAAAFLFIFVYNGEGKEEGNIVLPQHSAQATVNEDIAKRNKLKTDEITVTISNVRSVIAALERPDGYRLSAKITYYYGDESSVSLAELWGKNGVIRVDVKARGTDKRVLAFRNDMYIWSSESQGYYRGVPGSFTAFDEAGMPTYQNVLELNDTNIVDAGIKKHDSRLCIYLQSSHENGRFVRDWYIDIATALLISCSTRDENELIYYMEYDELELGDFPDELFAVPSVSVGS